jgi:RNase P subunit RPR2
MYTCTDCHKPIPAGKAHLRSVSFELVARCQRCQDERSCEHIAQVPIQRGHLSERVAGTR